MFRISRFVDKYHFLEYPDKLNSDTSVLNKYKFLGIDRQQYLDIIKQYGGRVDNGFGLIYFLNQQDAQGCVEHLNSFLVLNKLTD